MKLKTKAKILSGLLTISSVMGCIAPVKTLVAAAPTEREHHDGVRPRVQELSIIEFEYNEIVPRQSANLRQGDIRPMEEFAERVRTGGVALRLHNMNDLCSALYTIINYGVAEFGGGVFLDFVKQYVRNAAVNSLDNGHTLLAWLVSNGDDEASVELVRFLLEECNANPDIADEQGNTPLHIAVDYYRSNMVDILLSHNASPDITNHDGYTPYDLSTTSLADQIVRRYQDDIPRPLNYLIDNQNPSIHELSERQVMMRDLLRRHGITH